MQLRRVDMLRPFLNLISRTAYDVQHKQVTSQNTESLALCR